MGYHKAFTIVLLSLRSSLRYLILGTKESMMKFQRQNEIMCTVLLLWVHNTLFNLTENEYCLKTP